MNSLPSTDPHLHLEGSEGPDLASDFCRGNPFIPRVTSNHTGPPSMSTWALLHSSGDQFGGGKVSTLPTAAWHVWLMPAFQSSWSSCTIQERLCTIQTMLSTNPPYLYCSTGHQAQARSSIRFNDWIKTWIPQKKRWLHGLLFNQFHGLSHLVPTKVRWWVISLRVQLCKAASATMCGFHQFETGILQWHRGRNKCLRDREIT